MTGPGTPPSICANVAGPLEVWLGTGTSNALEFLGYTINGADIEEISFQGEIHSDEAGGEKGPPVDYQIFGTQHRISLELQRYNSIILEKLNLFYNKNDSPAPVVGGLQICGGSSFRVLLCSHDLTTFVRNYPACVIKEPVNKGPIGSQATRARVSFISNAVTGVVPWNTTTS